MRAVPARLVAAGLLCFSRPLLGQAQTDEQQIRAARDRFNTAIAAHDSETIDQAWTNDIQVVTSRGVSVSGRALYRGLFVRQFATYDDLTYRRRTDSVTVFSAWGMASEIGMWTGTWTDQDGPIQVGGQYVAQWRRTDVGWRLAAETFVALACSGGRYCKAP